MTDPGLLNAVKDLLKNDKINQALQEFVLLVLKASKQEKLETLYAEL